MRKAQRWETILLDETIKRQKLSGESLEVSFEALELGEDDVERMCQRLFEWFRFDAPGRRFADKRALLDEIFRRFEKWSKLKLHDVEGKREHYLLHGRFSQSADAEKLQRVFREKRLLKEPVNFVYLSSRGSSVRQVFIKDASEETFRGYEGSKVRQFRYDRILKLGSLRPVGVHQVIRVLVDDSVTGYARVVISRDVDHS